MHSQAKQTFPLNALPQLQQFLSIERASPSIPLKGGSNKWDSEPLRHLQDLSFLALDSPQQGHGIASGIEESSSDIPESVFGASETGYSKNAQYRKYL